jgi:hypothetical protein
VIGDRGRGTLFVLLSLGCLGLARPASVEAPDLELRTVRSAAGRDVPVGCYLDLGRGPSWDSSAGYSAAPMPWQCEGYGGPPARDPGRYLDVGALGLELSRGAD